MSELKHYCKDCQHCGAIPDFDGDWKIRICNRLGQNIQNDLPNDCKHFIQKPPKAPVIMEETDKQPPVMTVASTYDTGELYLSCINWEERRFQLVKSLACAYFSDPNDTYKGAAEWIVNVADDIIERLRQDEIRIKVKR